MDDQTLVQGLLRGDAEAQAFLDQTYRPRLYRACCHLLGYQDPEAEDVVQDVFLAAYRQVQGFEFRSSFYHWIYRICMYQCYEVIRKRKRQVVVADADLELMAQGGAREKAAREDEEKHREEILAVVRRERDAMGEPCRSLLQMRDVEGKSYADCADALKVPIGTVMSRLARCKDHLKKRLEKRDGLKP